MTEGIPGLSSVPVLGRLFGRTRTETQETDIVLTLTPHILRGLELDEEDLLPFRVSVETASAGSTGLMQQPMLQERLPPPPPSAGDPLGGEIQEPIRPPPIPTR